jgi:hypothetical protein
MQLRLLFLPSMTIKTKTNKSHPSYMTNVRILVLLRNLQGKYWYDPCCTGGRDGGSVK